MNLKKGLRLIGIVLLIALACALPVPMIMYKKDNLPKHTVEQIDEKDDEENDDIKELF